MTATTSPIPFAVHDSEVAKALPQRRRRITPEVGRALEKLGHAVEYLTDEFIHQGSKTDSSAHDDAVQLLMTLRRRVYMDTPETYSLGERCRVFLSQLLA